MSENIQEILNLTANAGLLKAPVTLAGYELKPITLASIALLQQLKSPLIAGKPIEDVENIVLDCCIFIKVQSLSVREATKLVFGPKEALLEAALDMASTIPPTQIEQVITSIVDLLRESTSTRVSVESEDVKDVMSLTKDNAQQGND
jgi:hypothetical protein